MNGATKLKRFKRIKRNIISATTFGIYLSFIASRCIICRMKSFWGRSRSFVEGRSSSSSTGSHYDLHNHPTSTSSYKSPSSSTLKSKTKSVGDSIVVSNILQRHRTYYNNRLPHNRYLYDILQVPGNATIQQIQQSYRTLSRIYHPDKRSSRKKNTPQRPHESDNDEIILQRIRSAYDLLKNDTKRFLYHRHGIIHSTQLDIMSILYPVHYSRRHSSSSSSSSSLYYDPSTIEIVHRWMGYNSNRMESKQSEQKSSLFTSSDPENSLHNQDDDSDNNKNEERIQNIMLFLIEKIRPIIENVPSASKAYEQYMYQDLIEQCDHIKVLPLGPSILRCIGRAYRYEGQRIIRHFKLQLLPPSRSSKVNQIYEYEMNHQYQQQHQQRQEQHEQQQLIAIQRRPISQYLFVMDRMRRTMRHVKHLTNAAIAGSRVYLQERHHHHKKRETERYDGISETEWNDNNIPYDNELLFGDRDDITTDSDNEQQQSDRVDSGYPTDEVMLESLQIDALWKVYKIELDSIVRQACRRILVSLQDPHHNVFLPSHVSDAMYDDDSFIHPPPHDASSFKNSKPAKTYDGWIVSNQGQIDGTTTPISSNSIIRQQQQQQLVANVLIRMGNILIERSKVGTSWMA